MPKIQLTTVDLLAGARVEACKKMPYLAKGLWRLTFIESKDVPTFAVDSKWRVYANPDLTRQCRHDATLAGCVLHEGLHRILKHEARAKTMQVGDFARWNRTSDAESNERIRDARMTLPNFVIYPENQGWEPRRSAEEYYKEDEKKQSQSQAGDGKDGNGGGEKPGDGHDGHAHEHSTCSGGSGVDGQRKPWELPDTAKGGVTEAEAEIVRAQVAEDIRKHAAAKGRGSVPSDLLRWAEEFGTPPPIPWQDLLAAQVRYQIDARVGPAPSYARPSRRAWDSMALPVHRMPCPRVVVVGDTSGSMGDADIAKIVASVYDAVETLGLVYAVGCDARASEVTEIRHIDDLRAALAGGGGTDMCVGLEKAAEVFPDAIVCVTDGETPWPDEAPEGIPVTIVLTRGMPGYTAPPAWATIIEAGEEANA